MPRANERNCVDVRETTSVPRPNRTDLAALTNEALPGAEGLLTSVSHVSEFSSYWWRDEKARL
jgi:hypothetical protein